VARAFAILLVPLVAGSWFVGVSIAPTVAHASPPAGVGRSAAAAMYAAGALVCHQRPERSFYREGAQLPVCARCTGLYAGGFLGALAWALAAGGGARTSSRARQLLQSVRPARALAWLSLPTAITVATAWLGWWDPPNMLRAAFAVPLGLAAGLVITAAASRDLR
jgi:uncharacterized membrane protein